MLPYGECPGALGSAGQVVGWSLDQLRRAVHRELVGTSSCTHLNDTLRSLADLDVLLAQRFLIQAAARVGRSSCVRPAARAGAGAAADSARE